MLDWHKQQRTVEISSMLALQLHSVSKMVAQDFALLFCQSFVKGFIVGLERMAQQSRAELIFERMVPYTHTIAPNC